MGPVLNKYYECISIFCELVAEDTDDGIKKRLISYLTASATFEKLISLFRF